MQQCLEQALALIRSQYGLAGGVLVAVKDGKTILKECFGLANVEENRPVDSKTFFQMASNSKAFTTLMAAQLCEEGKMTWDTPVKQLLPEFRMADPYVEAHVTPRDMACHRTGLCRHDIMRSLVREDRAQIVKNIAHYPVSRGFRHRQWYQNQMYVALGYLCEQLTGQTWEQLLTERAAKPLGMEMRFRGHVDITAINAAMPYAQKDGKVFRIPEVAGQASNPCGGMYTNLDSLERWVHTLANGGQLDGHRILTPESFANWIAPVLATDMGIPHPQEKGQGYALGWITSVYKGHDHVYHCGGTDGFNSMVGFFPGERMAYALALNTWYTPAYPLLGTVLRDILLDQVEADYTELFQIFQSMDPKPGFTAEEQQRLPLSEGEAAAFCGQYFHPGYGEMELCWADEGLHLRYGLLDLALERVTADRFVHYHPISYCTTRAYFWPDGKLELTFTPDTDIPVIFERVWWK